MKKLWAYYLDFLDELKNSNTRYSGMIFFWVTIGPILLLLWMLAVVLT